MDRYEAQFRVSENWWKAVRVIEAVCLLQNFGKLCMDR